MAQPLRKQSNYSWNMNTKLQMERLKEYRCVITCVILVMKCVNNWGCMCVNGIVTVIYDHCTYQIEDTGLHSAEAVEDEEEAEPADAEQVKSCKLFDVYIHVTYKND